jgi:hypothetical protein
MEMLMSPQCHFRRSLTVFKVLFTLCILVASLPLFAEQKLVLTIIPPTKAIHVTDHSLFHITISNRGSNSVTLVEPGDGSENAWRTPVIGWSVLPVNSPEKHPDTPAPWSGARCGNINPFRLSEVFSLEPGKEKQFEPWDDYSLFDKPGKYRVVLYYSNIPDMKTKGAPLGDHEKGAVERIKASTPCKLISNEVIVEVAP